MNIPVFTAPRDLDEDNDVESESAAGARLTQERADHERVKRQEREFNLAIKRGQYISREANRQAGATLLAIVAQHLRSLSDNLEREFSLAPETCEKIDQVVDAALLDLANGLKAMAPSE